MSTQYPSLYKASYSSGVYGTYTMASDSVEIPVIITNQSNYPLMPIAPGPTFKIPVIMSNFASHNILPISYNITDAADLPIINVKRIIQMTREHRKVSTAINELSEELPFSRITNYIVAKNMIMDLIKDNTVNLQNDVDGNDYQTPLGGIDDIIASFSSTTLQKLSYVGDKEISKEYDDDNKYSDTSQPQRRYFVGGNWKCNGSMQSVTELADNLSRINTSGVDVLVSPLSIHIPLVQSKLSQSDIIVSSQNVSATKQGAFTGEIAAEQLIDLGINTTLIGHSERRKYYGETNEIITEKVKIALKNRLNIICCLGETLQERQSNKVEQVCFASLKAIADGVGNHDINKWNNIVIAYEPVWAIGTGVACSPQKAQQTHKSLRRWFAKNISLDIANKIRIIYGGSVKPNNCLELIKQTDIDGFLVGGASLKPHSFGSIIKTVQNVGKIHINKQKIVICGGGNAAHIFTALAAANINNEVHVLSLYKTEAADFKSALNKTSDKLLTIDVTQEKRQIKAAPFNITNDPQCLLNADVVIISLPAFAHNQYLKAIKENIKPRANKKTLVAVFPGASGLECEWQSIFGRTNKYFVLLSCITLPWAARINQFGQNAEILGTKNQIEVCIKCGDDKKENDNNIYIKQISQIIGVPPKIVDNGHILNMSLSAINAIVHPPIMYNEWKDYDGKPLDKKPLFYQGINKKGAELLSKLSDEVLQITKCVEKETGLTLITQHIYEWYKSCYGVECSDTSSLYKIILTNPGYNGLTHPCIQDKNGKFKPNFKYRYLSEDIPYGLIVIRGLSLILDKKYNVKAPTMDAIIKWSQNHLNKEYLKYNHDGTIVAGKDINKSRAPQRYGIKTIKDLI